MPQLPENYNKRQIDPALLTYNEYLDIIDASRKCHPNSAYDVTLEHLNRYQSSKADFPKVIQHLRRHGLDFEVRLRVEKIGPRVKTDPDGMPLRINDELQYYSDEEAQRLGFQQHEWSLAIFEGDTKVAVVQDEWGCMLVMVAREYRSFGLGTWLLKLGYSIQPDKPSGGFTPSGMQAMYKVYGEFVSDALRTGKYRKLVQQGDMTMERVRAIVTSAHLERRTPAPASRNLASNNPQDWLLYVGEYGDFVIYDKKLREATTEGEAMEHFIERMIKGIAYVQAHDGREGSWAMLRAFGTDTPALGRFLMTCAIERANREQAVLYLEDDESNYVDPAMATLGPEDMVRGFRSRKVVPTGKRVDYTGLGRVEAAWRKTFDRYDEFRVQMLEMAYAKYRN